MKTHILVIVASIAFLYGCADNEIATLQNLQPAHSIFGDWAEVEPEGLRQMEGSTFTTLNLSEELSYQLTYSSWTDMLIYGNPCNSVNDFNTKGAFSITADSILFNGCYSDVRHSTCVARCDGVIEHRDGYEYKLTADSLILNPREHPMIRRVLLRR